MTAPAFVDRLPVLMYDAETRTFMWFGEFKHKEKPKSVGFRWNEAAKAWWTKDFDKAAKLVEYGNEECQRVLAGMAPERAANLDASRATDSDLEIPCPAGLAYMPFQRGGIAYGLARFQHLYETEQQGGVLIADEMGLGKTVQAVGLINADATVKRALVVCPASLKINWRRELERWLVRPLWTRIVGDHFATSDGVAIINYDVLHKHARAIAAWRPDLLIADEAHMAKNPNARRSKALYAIDAERLVYLTGTPIVNRPAELWPLVSHLAPDAFPDERDYMSKYKFAEATSRRGQGVLYALQQRLRASCMVRRLKKDVLTDLPPKRRQVIELPAATAGEAIANEQAAVSKFIAGMTELRLRVELAKASEEPADYAAAVKALKEGASAWFGEISKLRHETALAKVPAVVGHIKETLEEGNKVVLFAHHHDVIDSFMQAFPKVSVKLTGQMVQTERQRSVDLFQRDPRVLLFVGSIQAAGVGLTLTASSHAVFAELDWVPGNMSQAEDRTHRIGQVNSVLVQHLVLEGSLDATMAKTLVSKQEVIDAALDNEAGELADMPIVPIEETHASANLTRARIERDAAGMGLAERLRVHRVMQDLAGVEGLNLIDARIAAEFAAYAGLTPRQAALAQRIAQKYGRE